MGRVPRTRNVAPAPAARSRERSRLSSSSRSKGLVLVATAPSKDDTTPLENDHGQLAGNFSDRGYLPWTHFTSPRVMAISCEDGCDYCGGRGIDVVCDHAAAFSLDGLVAEKVIVNPDIPRIRQA